MIHEPHIIPYRRRSRMWNERDNPLMQRQREPGPPMSTFEMGCLTTLLAVFGVAAFMVLTEQGHDQGMSL